LAGREDSAAIEEILSQDRGAAGKIGVEYLRRPDPYASLCAEADKTLVALLFDNENGKACGMGCCQIRNTYLNNVPIKSGYFTLLRIVPAYRFRVPVIPKAFDFLLEHSRADIYYSTILQDNVGAQRMLEKPRAHVPRFLKVSDYTVYCFRTKKAGKSALITEECDFETFERDFYALEHKPDLCALPRKCDEMRYYRLRNGQAVKGVCAVVNQQAYKQYVITRYGGIYRFLSRLPLRLLGWPRFPRAGNYANYASVCTTCFHPALPTDELRAFIKNVGAANAEYDFIMLGATQNNPLNGAFRRIKNVKYKSILYAVGNIGFSDKQIALDVSFL
jgi:hypothetical protein